MLVVIHWEQHFLIFLAPSSIPRIPRGSQDCSGPGQAPSGRPRIPIKTPQSSCKASHWLHRSSRNTLEATSTPPSDSQGPHISMPIASEGLHEREQHMSKALDNKPPVALPGCAKRENLPGTCCYYIRAFLQDVQHVRTTEDLSNSSVIPTLSPRKQTTELGCT